ncbi:hypothetical protein [Pedobacter sp. BMA]|uniref:hypothetical protein n=1 Tax=Pedobacter sp. BMA TaxID=1663685 RepID=UPI000649AC98|nr:hypothetical protein [Pedobacter sp. BMA]KLT66472.1 hypothetical protein AB669_04590 [Pedobacter sp. BMA]
MEISHGQLNMLCHKLNGILNQLEKPFVWSVVRDGDSYRLQQLNSQRDITENILTNVSSEKCNTYLLGYYLGLRNISMKV